MVFGYKLYDVQQSKYFADDLIFSSLEDVRDQLISFHSVDCDGGELEKMTLDEIADVYGWEIHSAQLGAENVKSNPF